MKKSQKWPKISVITPSYNQGQFIEETIKSVIEQNYPNLEYIIIDGGSTDNSVSILKKYARKYPKIIRWVSEKDKGQSDAINKGLRMSTGEILCCLNSDDCFTKKALFKVADFFNKHQNVYIVTGDYLIIDDRGKEIQKFIRIYKKFFQYLPFKNFWLKVLNFINQPSTFWRREIYRKIGSFSLNYRYNMDYDYWLKIIKKGYKIGYISKPLSKFRIHKNSKGGSQFDKQFFEDLTVLKNNFGKDIVYYLHYLHNRLILGVYRLLR